MSNSTNASIATFVIKVNGNLLPAEMNVLSVQVTKQVNGIAKAMITIPDGSADTGTFDASSSNTFVPGNLITIEAGYDAKNSLLFSGMVTGQNLTINQQIGSALLVECHDMCIKMTVAQNSKTYFNTSDSAIIESIVKNYSGISATVTSTGLTIQQQIQASTTDWDFIQSLATANGMIATAVNNRLTVALPDANTTAVATIGYGDGLLEFNADLNAINQLAAVEMSSWDYPAQTLQSTVEPNTYQGPGNISSVKLSEVVGLSEYPLETTAMLSAEQRSVAAKAELTKANYAKITGKATIFGTTLVEPACFIELKGLGDRFSGNHFVSGVEHLLIDGTWTSKVAIGLAPVRKTTPQSGSLPGIKGLYNATVKQLNNDPNHQFSILVTVPVLDSSGTGIWARISQFYASNNAGAFFLPEVGDEVIVGFLNDDSGSPVILGSVYSNPQHQPYSSLQPQEKNPLKAIVSKSGLALTFDDENKILSLETPSKNTIVMSDQDKMLTVQDQNGNVFSLSDSGISMKSPKNISIQSGQTLSLEGVQGIQLKSSGGDLSMLGMNIQQTAEGRYSAEGAMEMELQSGTEMRLNSAMIYINE